VLTLQANQAVDHTPKVVAKVWPLRIVGVHVGEAFLGVEKPALHALARRHAILVSSADELLNI
jgi:hypothetical protein